MELGYTRHFIISQDSDGVCLDEVHAKQDASLEYEEDQSICIPWENLDEVIALLKVARKRKKTAP